MPQVLLPELAAKARTGEHLVSFPTDTVPALGSRPDRADLLFAAKQRDRAKPLILMAATIAELWTYVTGNSTERQIWQQVADRYLPGALTLVLPASERVPPAMNPEQPTTIGVRVPNHPVAIALLAQTGPLATTSANRSGEPALQTMTEIEAAFPQVFTLLPLELGALSHVSSKAIASGVPSTVIRWHGRGWDVLRQGVVDVGGRREQGQ
ncbi:MAG: L-threonylcarbamoyladenylate synthase [Stenomitos rutilans HA7619-LM2]|jgi:L-threonylcarbamoyladenylate synthase|nr:L-threonylcarbamoyladenylate synthase [Stenomitos rutilans HA7619-LM2]